MHQLDSSFNLPKFTHATPLLRSLYWLPVAGRIKFKTLMLTYMLMCISTGPCSGQLGNIIQRNTKHS
ncbi:hypothetical protein NFI96_030070, partial [Prochilodus magdalenae]